MGKIQIIENPKEKSKGENLEEIRKILQEKFCTENEVSQKKE